MKSLLFAFFSLTTYFTGHTPCIEINNDGTVANASNNDGTVANASAMLDIKRTTERLLIPGLTLIQRIAVATPARGLLVFQTDNTPGYYYYYSAGWLPVPAL